MGNNLGLRVGEGIIYDVLTEFPTSNTIACVDL
jgi:hypothetical protein